MPATIATSVPAPETFRPGTGTKTGYGQPAVGNGVGPYQIPATSLPRQSVGGGKFNQNRSGLRSPLLKTTALRGKLLVATPSKTLAWCLSTSFRFSSPSPSRDPQIHRMLSLAAANPTTFLDLTAGGQVPVAGAVRLQLFEISFVPGVSVKTFYGLDIFLKPRKPRKLHVRMRPKFTAHALQGYLAHKKQRPPRTLQ